MVVEFGIPSPPLDALRKLDETDIDDDYEEPAIPSARDQTTATTLEPPSVVPHEPLSEWPSVKRVPPPPRHTADEPNWAIAPDDPKRPAVTPTKKPRQGERRRGGRRGKHTRAQNTIPGASNASTYAESNSIDVQPSVVQPFLETNVPLQIGNPIKAAAEIITSSVFCPEERRLPDRTPGTKIHTNQPDGNAITQAPVSKAESYNISNLGSFVPKTCPVMESIVPFGDQLLLGPKGKDRRAPRRSAPWRRTTPILSVSSEPSLQPTTAEKEVPDILYQSSSKVSHEESTRLSVGLNKKMPLKWIATGIEPLMENPAQVSSSSSMISDTGPEVLGRLTWPSLEEEMRFHATERPLLLATKEVIKPKHSNTANGFLPPSSKQGPGYLPVAESNGLMAVSKVRCSPFDDTIASGRGNIPAKVNLPSRPSDWEAFSRDPGPRAAFQSGIPVPTRISLSRSNSLELDPFSQGSINFAHFSGREWQNSSLGNGTVSSGRPALQRPLPPKPSGGSHRSASRTFTLRRETEPTVYTRGTYSHPNAFTPTEIRPFVSHYLPAPSDDVRRAISRASRNEQDTPFPSGDHRAGDYHDQLSSTFPSENIRPSPTSFVGNFQENNPAPNPQISYTRGHIPAHRFAAYQPRDEKNGLN
ncbi:hypothetical protein GALMADRAFT_689340 [Galerina marginata CBS 339.88]|uniref:Uncharacterized protein n=1 Tax=Galerina marginata (strain CBS 339.88) TaxID=685588 RepID=A0A067TY88_GALM3|nr:hypothetical protein GALMADRAFT_689340 [Galerina marginata CBS 339.88]